MPDDTDTFFSVSMNVGEPQIKNIIKGDSGRKQLCMGSKRSNGSVMEALRQTNQHGKSINSPGGNNAVQAQQGQGMAALLVMIAVLCFIVGYCCWGAPCCRAFCRRRCCRGSGARDMEVSPSDIGLSVDQGMVATPTIILLPYGRMLVVDGSVFAQLQADTSGLDLIELGENVVRAHQRRDTPALSISTPSILEVDSDTTSKNGCASPVLEGFPPPTYDSIFGGDCEETADLPPSYSEILRQLQALAEESEDETMGPPSPIPGGEEYQPGEIRESRV
uniref:(California timema) hypothetical protein n=1 Tax=Timema californicum TaxID=61474 RepID=A0A7R9J7N0_TIMCA|nr:unnamed protein product [Timema californicum]